MGTEYQEKINYGWHVLLNRMVIPENLRERPSCWCRHSPLHNRERNAIGKT